MNRVFRMVLFLAPFLLTSLGCAAEPPAPVIVRQAVGGWFPENRDALKTTVDRALADAGETKLDGKPVAVIAPHAGYAYSAPTAAWAFKTLVGRTYDRVIVIGPSHYVAFEGAHVGD